MSDRLRWGEAGLTLEFGWSDTEPVHLAAVDLGDRRVEMPRGIALAEILTASHGHTAASARLVHSTIGEQARYVSHALRSIPGGSELTIETAHPETGLASAIHIRRFDGAGAAFRFSVTARNNGTDPVVLRSVTSFAAYLGAASGTAGSIRDWELLRGESQWLGETRWSAHPLRDAFPELSLHLTGADARGSVSVVSTGTWSTGKHLPAAVVATGDLAWAFQIEHNGAWRWEIGEDAAAGYLALSGPTETDHQWTRVLAPGEEFAAVPVSIAVADDVVGALQAMTRYRRRARRPHPQNRALPIVFNDYMNALNGDPSTQRLLPLVDAAAEVGAEVFCIDAGWYADGPWWDSVGEWKPSRARFPDGLGEVTGRIRARGMVPGLWIEPEVVGVHSPIAAQLPDAAFLQRAGVRILEQGRYHLDLRHCAARAHLDAVLDHLIAEYGVGYFKFDYNIDAGAGTDWDADSLGAGLLDHNRAHLAWLDSVLDRHPDLILENCGSGAMRSDFAMLSRLQLQSTSDQQDPMRYPPIAASAAVTILPEQAANWAYPQPEMSAEEIAFTLVTGLAGRFYLSGHLDRMSDRQRGLVAEAVGVAKSMRGELPTTAPSWPLGFPRWRDAWVSSCLASGARRIICLWSRDPAEDAATLTLPEFTGRRIEVTTVFPAELSTWDTSWDARSGRLTVRNPTGTAGARVLEVRPL